MDPLQDFVPEFDNEIEICETEILENRNDSTIGTNPIPANSLPGTSSSVQNAEWHIIYNSVSPTEDNMAQPVEEKKKKRIIIHLRQPRKIQKPKVADVNSSLTPNDVKRSGLKRKIHNQTVLEEMCNVAVQAPLPTPTPVLDLVELTSWGCTKKSFFPKKSPMSSSSSNASPIMLEENLDPQISYSEAGNTSNQSDTFYLEDCNDFSLQYTEEQINIDRSPFYADDVNDFSPRYTKDEIYMDRKRSPYVNLLSTAEQPYLIEYFRLLYCHERQKLIKMKEEKYYKERMEYLSKFHDKF